MELARWLYAPASVELDPPFRPVDGTEKPSFRGAVRGATSVAEFRLGRRDFAGKYLVPRVRDRKRRSSADDAVCASRRGERWSTRPARWIERAEVIPSVRSPLM